MCPLCKQDALVRKNEGTVESNNVTLIRCSACGFSWRERTNKVGGKDLITIKIVRNGNN